MDIQRLKAENDLLREQLKREREEKEKLLKANINLQNLIANPKKKQ